MNDKHKVVVYVFSCIVFFVSDCGHVVFKKRAFGFLKMPAPGLKRRGLEPGSVL